MHLRDIGRWQHDHTFEQEHMRPGERRTLIVVVLTATMMIVEIVAGLAYGSMALLADGLHMGSHAAALGMAFVAYVVARRYARDERFTFGTGKVNSLAGFTSAVVLVLFALAMAGESVDRLLHPVPIAFDQAILVAFLGLIVNGASIFILGVDHGAHRHERSVDAARHSHSHAHEDHNLRGAYLHVLADALTSLLAIFALLAGRFLGLNWMDPVMGVVGAILVARWSWGLLRDSGRILLDHQAAPRILAALREAIESHADNRVADLHVWSVGPGIHAAAIAVVTDEPQPPDHYKTLLPEGLGLLHVTVEVHPCQD
jgi:cation diffusion facilitator family transporter